MIYAVERLEAFLKPLLCSRRRSQQASCTTFATEAGEKQGEVSSDSKTSKSPNVVDIGDLSTESSEDFSDDSGPTECSSDGVLAASRTDTATDESDGTGEQQLGLRQPASKPAVDASALQSEIGEPQYVATTMRAPVAPHTMQQMYAASTIASPFSCAAPQFDPLGHQSNRTPPMANVPFCLALGSPDVQRDTLVPPPGLEQQCCGGVNYELPPYLPSAGFGAVPMASSPPQASWQQSAVIHQNAWAQQHRYESMPPATCGRVQDMRDANLGTDIGNLKTRLNNLSPEEAATLLSMLEDRASSTQAASNMSPWPQHVSPAAATLPHLMDMYAANNFNFGPLGAGGAARTMNPSFQQESWPNQRSPASFQERQQATRDGALRASEILATARKNAIPVHAQDAADGSMSTFLRDLSDTDNDCVLMVRKISQLGLDASNKLRDYFSWFGDVDRVMAVPTKRSTKNNSGLEVKKLRPPAAGFVVMSKRQAAEAVLNMGSSHVVAGVEIVVKPFQSHSIDGTD